MKKLISFVLAVMVFAAALPFAVSAEASFGDKITTPFTSIAVQDGIASLIGEDGNILVSFPGDYPDDCLVPNADYTWDPAALYDGPVPSFNGVITLTGNGGIANSFTWQCDGKTVSLTMRVPLTGTNTRTAAASDFDIFLYKNGWYLKNVSRSYNVSILGGTTTDRYRFMVMDATTNQPVRNEEGKCLYYLVSYETLNIASLPYKATEIDFVSGGLTASDFYMNLADTWYSSTSITSVYGEEDSTPAISAFTTPVTDRDGNEFTGRWYFYQWVVAKMRNQLGTGSYSVTHPIGTDTYAPFNEYTPKEGVTADIAYVLEGDGEILVYNSNDELIFPYEGDTENVIEMLRTEGGCGFNDKEEYFDEESGKTYQKWTNTVKTSPLGDINLDGEVTADDITVLAREIAGIENIPAVGYVISDEDVLYALGDVNFDGDVNADDLTALARAVAGIEALSAVGTTYSGVYEG